MPSWEEIIRKLKAGERLGSSEIEYVEKVFQTAEKFVGIALEYSAQFGPRK